MKLDDLAKAISAEVLTQGRGVTVEEDQVYAGDRISDLLNAAGENVLLISNLASGHLLRVAELMDVPGICLVGRQHPDAAMLQTAKEHGTLLMVSPVGLFETCGRVYRSLTGGMRSSP
jgi:hypothetical protein